MTVNLQQPIGSGFGASTTANEILRSTNLSGVNAIVTGGYQGSALKRCVHWLPPVQRSSSRRGIPPERRLHLPVSIMPELRGWT